MVGLSIFYFKYLSHVLCTVEYYMEFSIYELIRVFVKVYVSVVEVNFAENCYNFPINKVCLWDSIKQNGSIFRFIKIKNFIISSN